MSVERELQQSRTRTRKTHHEYRAFCRGRGAAVIPGRDIGGVTAERRDRHVRQCAQRPTAATGAGCSGPARHALRRAPARRRRTDPAHRASAQSGTGAGDGDETPLFRAKAREQHFGFGMFPLRCSSWASSAMRSGVCSSDFGSASRRSMSSRASPSRLVRSSTAMTVSSAPVGADLSARACRNATSARRGSPRFVSTVRYWR